MKDENEIIIDDENKVKATVRRSSVGRYLIGAAGGPYEVYVDGDGDCLLVGSMGQLLFYHKNPLLVWEKLCLHIRGQHIQLNKKRAEELTRKVIFYGAQKGLDSLIEDIVSKTTTTKRYDPDTNQ